jgi:methylase of polypeptide subunit release factors
VAAGARYGDRRASLAALGAALRLRGLAGRALAAWAVPRLSALPFVLPNLPRAEGTAGALLELFVAGREIALDRLGAVDLDALHAERLVDLAGGVARARVAVLPLGGSLLVCDRLDAPPTPELVCWPDDSSYHLALSLPGAARAAWIDLGCGSAFAPLLRPTLAVRIDGTDLNPRAVELAELGAALSGVSHFHAFTGDLDDGLPGVRRRADLVTCNAPIPEPAGDAYRPMWRATDLDFIARLVTRARELLTEGGTVVVHAAEDALAPVVADLVGERVIVSYTPPGVRGFAVAWWRPDAPDRHVATRRDLTETHPHLTSADRQAAIAS